MAGSAALKGAVEALDLLLGRGVVAGTDAGPLQATKHADLLESLRCNMAVLEEKLAQEPQWDELRRHRGQIIKQAQWFVPCSDVPWSFTSQILLLLLCLKECMALLAATYQPPPLNPKTAEAAPPLSPDTLSIAQEKTVQAALQFVVMLGLCPYLLPGVGLPLRCRTEFSALVQVVASPSCLPGATRKLYTTCTILLQISWHPTLGSLLLARHLGDLLAGLCQLGFCPARRKGEQAKSQKELMGLAEEERSGCREALRGLLDRVYQPLAVQELLLLQGGSKQAPQPQGPRSGGSESEPGLAPAPAWLRRLCGQLLSERLGRPGGVQAVVRGILEGAGAGPAGGSAAEAAASDWQKCDAVARILSSCPQQSLSPEDYFRQLCPQLLQLLLIQDKLAARQFQRVATTTILAVAWQHPQLAEKYLLRPMLEPLLRYSDMAEVSLEGLPAGTELMKEEELSSCVENVFKVYVVGNEPSAVLLDSLQMALGVLFSLWCFTKQNVSYLRTPCQAILLWFLEKSKGETALSTLEGLSGLRGATPSLHPLCQFQAASEGGVRITVRAAVSDEEEALYQKVSSEQWQLEQLVVLVAQCQHSSLAGDFFNRCLKELTPLAGQGASPVESSLRSCQGSADLEQCCGQHNEQQERQLRVLQLVALLCSSVTDTLFTSIVQVVEFVAATLQRACAGLVCSSETTVESQTLSMAMGLVAVLLGGAVQLQSADFATLKQLVPLLEEVSRVYPEPVIQELAADLRIAICTHGAFAAEVVQSAAQSVSDSARKSGPAGKARDGVSPDPAEDSQDEVPQPRVSTDSNSTADGGSATVKGHLTGKPVAGPCSSSQDLQELLLSAYDPDIPARAATLRTLSHLIEQRDPAALAVQKKLLEVFVENLEHEDSFVYLSAIQGVALLSDTFPEQVLPSLLDQYGSPQPATRRVQTVETRMKVGEALMRTTRALGDMVFPHRDDLIHAFLRGARDPDSTLRASSLSNLGELCQILHFQLSAVVHEVASCLTAVAKTDPEAEVRRAAIHVVVLLLRGLSEKATEVLQDVLLDLYRLLKSVVLSEQDEVTVLHAQLALEELDGIMRDFLFPRQTFEKKIVVLP
ncbi:transport and Golgi organization protein 6 homolog [Tiliqua scincoides]|uniref:transport and Golgi organization protein 6 homolog n=1 Tax=Tiliqua scincoides TaxID=71010 RepID=UPI0034632840